MRITTSGQYRDFLASLQTIRQRLATTQEHLSSGHKLGKPSDDPAGAGEALLQRGRLAAYDRYASNATSIQSFLNVSDSALSGLNDILTTARADAIRGASEPSGNGREAIAHEIDALREQALALARTSFQGRYVFAGTDTRTNPYDDSGNYLGNAGEIRAEIGDGETLAANLAGPDVFGAGTGIFGVLQDLADNLRAGDTTAIQAAADTIETARQNVSTARSIAGERLTRLTGALDRAADARVAIRSRLSSIEDADIAQEITNLASDRTAEQATLQTGARIGHVSLFDFLG